MRAAATFILLAAAALSGCGEAVSGGPDAAVAGPDAAVPVPDAAGLADASTTADAEAVAPDSGRPDSSVEDPADAAEAPDAEAPGLDAAAPGPDAGPPAGCLSGSFTPRFGDLHAHTSYSDGAQTPADAFDYARNVAGLDILIVTDHLEQVSIPVRWWNCRSQADDKDAPGQFVAACGFEYAFFEGIDSTGHSNVFFDASLMNATKLDYLDFYSALAGCSTCVGQFNHPGDEPLQTWGGFALDAAAEPKLALFELNGGGAVWDLYFEALDKGWHVSPQNNQDNHSADWGTADSHRSGFFLADLTRDALRQAMLERRTFSTEDANASLRLMAQDVCWMGSRLSGVGSALRLHVEAEDKDAAESFSQIELFGPGKTLLGTQACAAAPTCEADFEVALTAPTYVVARATGADGDVLVSAPIWAEP